MSRLKYRDENGNFVALPMIGGGAGGSDNTVIIHGKSQENTQTDSGFEIISDTTPAQALELLNQQKIVIFEVVADDNSGMFCDVACYTNEMGVVIFSVTIDSNSQIFIIGTTESDSWDIEIGHSDHIGKAGTSAHGEIFNDYENNQAKGLYSHAEGYKTTAQGNYSHAEGYNTSASSAYGHAEGSWTNAMGNSSHAEGNGGVALGTNSHVEGTGTHATTVEAQHVQGKYNIIDNDKKYAHIVGNGADDDNRSNAHTLDWDGNAWFAGDITIPDPSVTGEANIISLVALANTQKAIGYNYAGIQQQLQQSVVKSTDVRSIKIVTEYPTVEEEGVLYLRIGG